MWLLVVLWILLLLHYNHFVYKAYLKITYKTLYHDIEPKQWRDYLIYQKIK